MSLLLSCGSPPPTAPPRTAMPVVLASPDAPTAEEQQLAQLAPQQAEHGDAEVKLAAALDAFYARTNARRGYLAVDKPLYQPGETIWFRAFALQSATFAGGARELATVKLISPRGSTVAEKQIAVEDFEGGNDIMLPMGVAGGEYILRAATASLTTERRVIVAAYEAPRIKKKLEFVRKAYGPGDTVTATVALHRATGEAIASRPLTALAQLDGAELSRAPAMTDTEGNAVVQFALPADIHKGDGLLTILVDDGGVTESVQKRIPITLRDLQFAAYPEGGDLVEGLPGHVYFQAKTPLDKPADIEGRIVDDRGAVAALFRSYHDGMGRFSLVPQPGRTYHAEVTRPTGLAKPYPLPAAKASGCTLHALDDFASARADLRVAVWCQSAQRVTAAATLRDARVAMATVSVRAGEPAVIALPMPAAAQGAVRVTLFDAGLAPLAERLVYRNRGADLKITVTQPTAAHHPRERVELTVETKGPDGKPVAADLALSAVDDTVLAFADDKQANILARLYLEAELPGQKVEEPNFYFGDDKQAPAALDMVLGTQGYRRFDWKPVFAAPPKPPAKPITDPWTYTGDVQRAHPKHRRLARAEKGKAGGAAPAEDPADEEVAFDQKPREVQRRAEAAPALPEVAAKAPAHGGKKRVAAKDDDGDDGADDDKPMPKKQLAKADLDEAVQLDGQMMRNIPVGRAPPAPMEAMEGGIAEMDIEGGEMIAVRHRGFGRQFDDRGFDIGADHARRKHRIREAAGRDEEEQPPPDPFCCLAPERQFPMPTYDVSYAGPRTDFRETVLWHSNLHVGPSGTMTVPVVLSDAVTSFRVTAEGVGGGRAGRGEALVASKKPVSLAVKLPLEVSAGDHLKLPVTISNETDRPYQARLAATFGKAFALRGGAAAPTLALAPGEHRSFFYELDVVGDGADAAEGKVAISVDAANLRDEVERTISVVPLGFPQERSIAGTLEKTVRHEVLVGDVLPGTMHGDITLYPSPLATMVQGTEAMIAEPGGCFEQASSTNYPNIMILGYLEENQAAAPAVVERAHLMLDKGYRLLTGYETKSRGYEWFGGDPGHEALTAYGLMEFHDMAKVYGDVDRTMVDRTREWLRGRRDGKGGFQRNPRQLDSFGGASPEVTNAYIAYALSEAGEQDLKDELEAQRAIAAETKDPYLLALSTKTLENASPKSGATHAAVAKLAALQAADGGFPGAKESITRSGGDALEIETTALATMALMAAGPDQTPQVRKGVQWLDAHRNGSGAYGSTQSTVLALKALTAYAKDSRRTSASGVVVLRVNGEQVERIAYEKGHQGAITVPLGTHLKPGKNVIELTLDSSEPLPYSGLVKWGSRVPAADPATAVSLQTSLAASTVKLGESAHMDVRVTNKTGDGQPMTLARVGLPGGLTFQTWQLQELRDKGLIAFYETRPREVILYFRSLAPHAAVDVPLELMATTPGTFTAPASRAYLYYTAERKAWVAPSAITVAP